MMKIKDYFCAEIDELIALQKDLLKKAGDSSFIEGSIDALQGLRDTFIDFLPEEFPPYCTGFKGDPSPSGISDLEEAAEKYAYSWRKEGNKEVRELFPKAAYRAFIAGAEWQKEQMPMPEDTVLFQKGVEEGRRLERDDLALTWKDMVLLRTLFDATDANQSMGALTVQPMTREYYEYLLREFNEQRKK